MERIPGYFSYEYSNVAFARVNFTEEFVGTAAESFWNVSTLNTLQMNYRARGNSQL
jgi:hypothetical protein